MCVCVCVCIRHRMRRKERERRREGGGKERYELFVIHETADTVVCIPRRVVCLGQLVNLSVGLSGALNSAVLYCLLAK